MTFRPFGLWIGLVIGIGLLPSFSQAEHAPNFKPFAVVELFTSEGCSSCPPADILLSKLIAGVRPKDLNVYALSFHVDYWNRLGWRDPFSKRIFTQRQYDYAAVLELKNIFTPHMVINGRDSLVGSDSRKLQKAVNKALGEPAWTDVQLKLNSSGNPVSVLYSLQGRWRHKVLNAALVQIEAVMDVNKGENAGRRLKHSHVVREFLTVPLKKEEGELNFHLPADNQQFAVIAFIQDPQTMEIFAATRLDL